MSKGRIYKAEELQAICSEWQNRLRLQDWDISVQLTHQYAIDDAMAFIQINWCHKKAIISIPTPGTYSSKIEIKQDMLSALVHELIHIHLESFFPPEPEDESREASKEFTNAEYAINVLSSAFANLYDESQRKRGD